MKFEDEYLDVLQNIEFAIISVYREHSDLRDYAVMRALDALIECYRAESRGHAPKQFNLPEKEALIFQRTKDLCEFRLGRGGLGTEAEILPTRDKTVDEILACLRRIRKSVDRWNKHGGPQGYLKFASQFIK
jgi:hypothetical protein